MDYLKAQLYFFFREFVLTGDAEIVYISPYSASWTFRVRRAPLDWSRVTSFDLRAFSGSAEAEGVKRKVVGAIRNISEVRRRALSRRGSARCTQRMAGAAHQVYGWSGHATTYLTWIDRLTPHHRGAGSSRRERTAGTGAGAFSTVPLPCEGLDAGVPARNRAQPGRRGLQRAARGGVGSTARWRCCRCAGAYVRPTYLPTYGPTQAGRAVSATSGRGHDAAARVLAEMVLKGVELDERARVILGHV
jgi:hypothetical protein